MYLSKPWVDSGAVSAMTAGASTCTNSHTGQCHLLTLCSGKPSFSFKAQKPSKCRCLHTGVLSTHASAQEYQKRTNRNSFKHQAFAPPWIWAFHTLCPLWGTSYCESKKHDQLLSSLIHAGLITPQYCSIYPLSYIPGPHRAEASCKHPG